MSIRGKAGERKPRRKDSRSGILGVYPTKNGKWKAEITFKGKTYYLGRYRTKEEAKQVRERAEEDMFDKAIEEWVRLQEEMKEMKAGEGEINL